MALRKYPSKIRYSHKKSKPCLKVIFRFNGCIQNLNGRKVSMIIKTKLITSFLVLCICAALFIFGYTSILHVFQGPKNFHKATLIETVIIGGDTYYIPRILLSFPERGAQDEVIYLKLKSIFSEGSDWKSEVRILAEYHPKINSINFIANELIKALKAQVITTSDYGLEHRTQTADGVQDAQDMWLEKNNDTYLSFIRCTEIISSSSVPQCFYHTNWKNFHIQATFDKNFLPEWRNLAEQIPKYFESFKTEKSAIDFVKKYY